jgi:uncharacterized protein VirK/YbjX
VGPEEFGVWMKAALEGMGMVIGVATADRWVGPTKAFRKAWRLGHRAYGQERPLRRLKQKVRWSLLAAAWHEPALAWFARIETGDLRPFAARNPMLCFKPMRAYLSARWGRTRRATALSDAYAFALAKGGAMEAALLRPEGACLATLPGGSLGSVEVRLGTEYRLRKEGEWALSLQRPGEAVPLMSMAFGVLRSEGGWAFHVGAVQGREEAAEDIRTLTKALHGLRPKALLPMVLQTMAAELGVARILAAGNAIQVHRKKHAIHLPFVHRLSFDYDGLWAELGASPAEGGWFALPLRTPRREREEIKPNKRTQYARRYALLDELEAGLASELA